jgi:hypothetical protein
MRWLQQRTTATATAAAAAVAAADGLSERGTPQSDARGATQRGGVFVRVGVALDGHAARRRTYCITKSSGFGFSVAVQ